MTPTKIYPLAEPARGAIVEHANLGRTLRRANARATSLAKDRIAKRKAAIWEAAQC